MKLFGRTKKDEISVTDEDVREILKKLRKAIPEYKEYERLDNRDPTDRCYRVHLLTEMQEVTDIMKECHQLLIQAQVLATWSTVEQILGTLGTMTRMVESPDYRFSTFFETTVLEGIEVDIIYELENTTLEQLTTVKSKAIEARGRLKVLDIDGIGDDIISIGRDIGSAHHLISDRTELITSFEKISI